MRPTGRFFTVILAAMTLWILACGGAQQPDAVPQSATVRRATIRRGGSHCAGRHRGAPGHGPTHNRAHRGDAE